jgi:hypothetical protein
MPKAIDGTQKSPTQTTFNIPDDFSQNLRSAFLKLAVLTAFHSGRKLSKINPLLSSAAQRDSDIDA